jgi:hypothetical protein
MRSLKATIDDSEYEIPQLESDDEVLVTVFGVSPNEPVGAYSRVRILFSNKIIDIRRNIELFSLQRSKYIFIVS